MIQLTRVTELKTLKVMGTVDKHLLMRVELNYFTYAHLGKNILLRIIDIPNQTIDPLHLNLLAHDYYFKTSK